MRADWRVHVDALRAPAPQLDPHQVRYKLLGQVTAKACAKDEESDKIKRTKSPDPRAIGVGYLFEKRAAPNDQV